MTFAWRTIAIGVLLVIVVVTCRLAAYYNSRAVAAENSLASTDAIARNATTAINLMYDISKAASADRQSQQQKGERHVVYIREAVKGDDCATSAVPSSAADRIRLYADSLRSGASGKDKS